MDFRKRFAAKGRKFSIADHDPDDTAGFKDDQEAVERTRNNTKKLEKLHDKLYAEHRYALLIVLQAMDTAGKDSTIKHVMSGVNPVGCVVSSFKQPSQLEKDHDFLWRVHQHVPERGSIGIFNRSHYEDVLIVRVHQLVAENIWSERYEQIRDFEKMLYLNDVRIIKFFLNISHEEQLRRFKERLADPTKNWKFSEADMTESRYWDEYQKAYQDALARCSRKHAPWYVIPSNKKWFRNLAVSQIIVDTLEDLHLEYPVTATSSPAEARTKKQ